MKIPNLALTLLPKKETPICETLRLNSAKWDSRNVSMNPWQTAQKTVPKSASKILGSVSIFLSVKNDEFGDESEPEEDFNKTGPINFGNLHIVIIPTTRQSPPLNSNGKMKSPT